MDTFQILKKSWQNVWRYRALWVFGVILALTTFSWGPLIFTGGHDGDDQEYSNRSVEFVLPDRARTYLPISTLILHEQQIERVVVIYKGRVPDYQPRGADLLVRYTPNVEFSLTEITSQPGGGLRYDRLGFESEHLRLAIMILVGLAAFALIMWILTIVGRYVSTTALIHMVDEEAQTGGRLSARQGLGIGWSRTAWRLFLIDLCINIPAAMAVLLLFALVAAPVILATSAGSWVVIAGAVISGGLFFLAILATILGLALLGLLRVFVRRACVLEHLGVFAAISSGYATLRSDLMSAGLVWLVWVGLRAVWPLLMMPVGLLLLGLAIFIGGMPGLLVGGLSSIFASGGDLPAILGIIVGFTLFTLTLFVPLVFLGGLREVFFSSMWTLTYREIHSQAQQISPAPLRRALEAPQGV